MASQRFNTEDFAGIVQFKQYALMPDGKQYIGVFGKVSILRDEEVVGFKVAGGETANWIARVTGLGGSVNILGCQIKVVHQFNNGIPDDLSRDYYQVP